MQNHTLTQTGRNKRGSPIFKFENGSGVSRDIFITTDSSGLPIWNSWRHDPNSGKRYTFEWMGYCVSCSKWCEFLVGRTCGNVNTCAQ